MVVRISRAIISRPLKPIFPPRVHDIPPINKNPQVYSKHPVRFYLFPSVYRSFFASYGPSIGHYQQSLSNLMPFRSALNEIKRRLFFAGLYFRSCFVFFIHSFVYMHITALDSSTHSTVMRNREKKKEEFLTSYCIKKRTCAI